ncbi:MAG: VTT domain-containing protein [Candidatus Woesearchaeota archaeon]
MFYSELKAFSQLFISMYGFFGLFVLVVLMDTIIQPISPDILVLSSTFGGANLWLAALIGGIASCVAGSIGYTFGKALGEDGFVKWFGKTHLRKGRGLFRKYGIWAVIVGALSPIPYSSVCWTAGIYDMDFLPFVVTSALTRIPRFFFIGLIGTVI